MYKAKQNIYLMTAILAIILGIVAHQFANSILDIKAIILFYIPILLMFIPSVFFLVSIKGDIKKSKPLSLLVIGYLIGASFIFFIALKRLFWLSDSLNLMSISIFIIFKIIVICLVMIGVTWNFFSYYHDLEQKIYYAIIGVSYSFFILSVLIGFYKYNSIVGISAPYLHSFDIFFSYFFQDFIYFFTFIGVLASMYAKYKLLSNIKRIEV